MSRFVCSHDLSRMVIFAKWRLCSLVINGNNPFQIFKDVKKVIDPLKEVYLKFFQNDPLKNQRWKISNASFVIWMHFDQLGNLVLVMILSIIWIKSMNLQIKYHVIPLKCIFHFALFDCTLVTDDESF